MYKIITYSLIAFISITFISCQKQNEKKTVKVINAYGEISENWVLNTKNENNSIKSIITNWDDYNLLKDEMSQKPQSTLGSIRQKAASLSKKSEKLLSSLPSVFNNQDVRSRIMVLISNAKMLENRVNSDFLNQKAIKTYNIEIINSFEMLQSQMERVHQRAQIQMESGEMEMRQKMLLDSINNIR